MKPRYSFTIIDPITSGDDIEAWVKKHWGYDYWNENWYLDWRFILNFHP